MITREASLKGSHIATENRKRQAREAYYKDPNICAHCKAIIEVKENERPAQTRKKKFCSRSCAAKANNLGVNRWNKKTGWSSFGFCEKCQSKIQYRERNNAAGGYIKVKYCETCRSLVRAENAARLQGAGKNWIPRGDRSVGQLKEESKGNYWRYRVLIQKHARQVYNQSERPKCCEVCGYDKHYEVCHRKAVIEFSDETLVRDVNRLDNLIALCPTHHWELDNGILDDGAFT